MGEFTHAMRNPVAERDARIRELESVLARAYAFINDATALDAPGTPGVTLALDCMAVLGMHKVVEPQRTADNRFLCKSTDCWLCHGTPANAGPR